MSEHYEKLRALVSPVVAVSTFRGDELNALIVNSALRASLSPVNMRLSIIVHKFNYSHDMIFESGVFTVHVLRSTEIDLVIRFGCASGRDTKKFEGLSYEFATTGAPILPDSYAYYECRVVNAMDTGGSTIFLGSAVSAGGTGQGEILTSAQMRGKIPVASQEQYQADLDAGQRFATERDQQMSAMVWRTLRE